MTMPIHARSLAKLSVALFGLKIITFVSWFFYNWPSISISNYLSYPLALTGFAYVVFKFSKRKSSWELSSSLFLALILLSSIAISVVLQQLLATDSLIIDGLTPASVSLNYLLVGLTWFCLGAAMQGLDDQDFGRNFFLIPALVFVVCVASSLSDGLILNYKSISDEKPSDLEISHLTIGSYAVVALLLPVAFSTRPYKFLAFAGGVLLFFCLGGRANLFVFILTCSVFYASRLGLIKSTVLLSGSLIVLTLALLLLKIDLNDAQVQKMIFYDGFSEDQSEAARDLFFWGALDGLPRQALYGDPGYLIEKFYSLGAYSHNLLSAWQFFGVAPFVLFAVSMFFISRKIFAYRFQLRSSLDEFGILLFVFCLISIMFVKSINFFPFWMSLGFWFFRLDGLKFQGLNRGFAGHVENLQR